VVVHLVRENKPTGSPHFTTAKTWLMNKLVVAENGGKWNERGKSFRSARHKIVLLSRRGRHSM
jgi:hypothetical protein